MLQFATKSEQNVNYDYVYFFYRHFYVSTSIFRIIDSNDDTCRLLLWELYGIKSQIIERI